MMPLSWTWDSCTVMQTMLNDDRLTSNTLSLHFLNGKRNFGIREWPHLNIASLAQVHPSGSCVGCVCVCMSLNILPYQWMNFMNKKLLRWDHRPEVENILRHRHPQRPSHTPACVQVWVGANRNESHQSALWMTHSGKPGFLRQEGITHGATLWFHAQIRTHSLHLLFSRCFHLV